MRLANHGNPDQKTKVPHKEIKIDMTSQKEISKLEKLEAELQKNSPDKTYIKKSSEFHISIL